VSFNKSLIEFSFRMQYQTQRLIQRWRFRNLPTPAGGWPVLMGISFPKSGTNLIRQVLAGFTQVAPFADRSFDVFSPHDYETGQARTAGDALTFLARLKPGDIAQVHFYSWPEVIEVVCTPHYIPFFIYRDPRDVVVSHMFYVTRMAPEHSHHQFYAGVLKTDDERLSVSITGRPEVDLDFPHINKRFEPYLGWLDHSEVLSLRFEDFIMDRNPTLNRVLDHYIKHLDLKMPREKMLDILVRSINPSKSPTFRGGRVGDWRKHFKDEHKALFKNVAGDLLIRLGYEKGYDW